MCVCVCVCVRVCVCVCMCTRLYFGEFCALHYAQEEEKLQAITLYLRTTYHYCIWCGTKYEGTEFLILFQDFMKCFGSIQPMFAVYFPFNFSGESLINLCFMDFNFHTTCFRHGVP